MFELKIGSKKNHHNRKYRRKQMFKAKRRAEKLYNIMMGEEDQDNPRWKSKFIHSFAVDRKPCSCWMCGNQRKWHGPPVSDLKEEAREEFEMNDLDWSGEELGKIESLSPTFLD